MAIEKATALSPTSSEGSFLDKHMGTILGAVLGCVLGAGGTLFTTWWTAKQPHLTKFVSSLLPFQGAKGETAIVNLTLTSDGSKAAEDIDGYIKIEGSTIDDLKIFPEFVRVEKSINGDSINLKIKVLNSGESVQVSALVRKTSGIPSKPDVHFRGLDVVAEEKQPQDYGDYIRGIGLGFSITGLCLMIMQFIFARRIKIYQEEYNQLLGVVENSINLVKSSNENTNKFYADFIEISKKLTRSTES